MPLRTCLVTGKKDEAETFFRFTVQDGRLVFDTHQKASGRGGYVVKEVEALDKLSFLNKKIVHFMNVKKVIIKPAVIEAQKQLIIGHQ